MCSCSGRYPLNSGLDTFWIDEAESASREEHVWETQREGGGHAGGGEWRMECGFEPSSGQRQVEHDFESGEWFRSLNLPPVVNRR